MRPPKVQEVVDGLEKSSLESKEAESGDKPRGRRLISTADIQARKASNESVKSEADSEEAAQPKTGRRLIDTDVSFAGCDKIWISEWWS